MEQIRIFRMKEVRRALEKLKDRLNVKIEIKGSDVVIGGEAIEEFEAVSVFDAINFGFSAEKALKLKDEDYVFRVIHIKEHTKRNLKDVRGRLIGTKGKTKRVFSETSGCDIMIKESEVGIIGIAEDVEHVETAVIAVIKGTKQGNMYKYLEKMNRARKNEGPIIE